jgi:hypothetical protein
LLFHRSFETVQDLNKYRKELARELAGSTPVAISHA